MKNLFAIVLFALSCSYSFAQKVDYFNPDGVAISGVDPVAYFTESAAMQGEKQFSYSWQGTAWRFKNQANMDLFKANPEKYAPQFGGYCAYGVSQNHKSSTEPEAFTILDGKLYLNYNLKIKELWIKETKGYIEKAKTNWNVLKDRKN